MGGFERLHMIMSIGSSIIVGAGFVAVLVLATCY